MGDAPAAPVPPSAGRGPAAGGGVTIKRMAIKFLFPEFGKASLPPFEFARQEAAAYLDRDFTAMAGAAARRAFASDPLARVPLPGSQKRTTEAFLGVCVYAKGGC